MIAPTGRGNNRVMGVGFATSCAMPRGVCAAGS